LIESADSRQAGLAIAVRRAEAAEGTLAQG
jgi:hypothetical protein